MKTTKRFAFGKNWRSYLKGHFSEVSLNRAVESLQNFLPESLEGKTFLDAGCGSGVHSLAAFKLGARSIISFDSDEDSVAGTQELKDSFGSGANWVAIQGSLLDDQFLDTLGSCDVVYCWGVAHHTGDMWKALRNLYDRVSPGGYLFIAIYNTVDGRFGSHWWQQIKKFYNHSPSFVKKMLEWMYISFNFTKLLISLRNPFRFMKKYEDKRGMSWKVDLIDWLGGYPYEHAKPEEIHSFYTKELGMELIQLKTTNYIGCNQFVFKRK